MPKKRSLKKKKNASEERVPEALQENLPLPQVWLTVQPGLEQDELRVIGSQADLIETKPKKKVIIKEETDELILPQNTSDILIPQEVTTIGWDEQEELDYSKVTTLPVLPVVRKPSLPTQDWPRRPSGISCEGSMFNYSHSSIHHVKYIGEIRGVSSDWVDETAPQSILKVVEMAQRHGEIPWKIDTKSTRLLIISKYGIKFTDNKKQRVFGRYPLHNIVNVIHYTSVHMTPVIALRIHREQSINGSFDLHLYECQSNEQASDICVTLGQAFDTITNKMRMEENLHGPLVN